MNRSPSPSDSVDSDWTRVAAPIKKPLDWALVTVRCTPVHVSSMTRRMLHAAAVCLLSGCASLNPLKPLEHRLLFQSTELEKIPPETDFESVRIQVETQIILHGRCLENPATEGFRCTVTATQATLSTVCHACAGCGRNLT